MTTFQSAPQHVRTSRKASASSESQSSSSDAKTRLPNWLYSNLQNPPRTLPVHDVIHIPRSIFYLGFLLWHVRSACVNTCAHVHLTNPFAERKVLSLTKPKGKIYKTKYLGHYITKDYKPNLTLSTKDTLLSMIGLFQKLFWIIKWQSLLLGINHLSPHYELVHLPYIAVTPNTRTDKKVKSSFL